MARLLGCQRSSTASASQSSLSCSWLPKADDGLHRQSCTARAARQQDAPSMDAATTSTRRAVLVASVAAPLMVVNTSAYADTAPSAVSASGEYVNPKQGYRLVLPQGWRKVDKAGADALFEDPARTSTSLGVVVNPVRVKDIASFGSLEDVGQKLLEAERKKESTISAEMVRKAARTGPSGATFYDYEYALDSTRGRKQILNTVTIAGSRLYILNANYKCDKAASAESSGEGGVTQSGGSSSSAACGGSPTALGAMAALRAAAASFDLLLN